MGRKCTKLKKCALLLCEKNTKKNIKGALLLWEENTENLKRVLCYCVRKIHKTLKRCSVSVGRKCTKLKKLLCEGEENVIVGG